MAFSTFNSIQSFLMYVRARVSDLAYVYNFPALDPSLVLYYPLDSSANVGGGVKTANFASRLPVFDASMAGSSMITYAPNNSVTSFGDLSLNNTMGAQLVARTVSGNFVVANNTFAPNISGGFSISLWFSCSGQLNKRGTLISLPPSVGANGLQIDVSGTNMIYSGWNAANVVTDFAIYYPLTGPNTISGTQLYNGITKTYDGTLFNSPVMSNTTFIIPPSSLNFPNTAYCAIPSFTNTSTQFSISLWFNKPSIGSHTIFLAINGNNIIQIFTQSTSTMLTLLITNGSYGSDANINTNIVSISANTWYHLVWVVNGTNWSVYLNNTLYTYSSKSLPTIISYTTTLGGSGSNNFTVNGFLQDFRVYNRVLTAAEVTSIYNYRG